MNTFTIDADHNITAYANAEEAKQGDAAGVISLIPRQHSPSYRRIGR